MSATQKTPIAYHGGKQKLAKKIIDLFPEHKLYAEPYLGGGAVFFQKEPSHVEVINDTNRSLIDFYEVVQNDFVSLEKEIRISLHSRDLHRKARVVYNNPDMFDKLKRAWAVWVLSSQSFASKLDSSWGYDRNKNETSKKIRRKRESFTEDLAIRLQETQIECTDAIRIINSRDSEGSFFYCDPPYFNSDQGHYDGFTVEDYEMLLVKLSKIEGKFLLSSYPSKILDEYIKDSGWFKLEMKPTKVTVANKDKKEKKKTEVLVANYPIG